MGPTLRKRNDGSPEKSLQSQNKSDNGQVVGSNEDQVPKVSTSSSRQQSTKIPGFVLFKLILFSALAIILPIFVFYYTLESFGSTYAGVWAAATANFVLFMYIVVAYTEGEDDQVEGKSK